VGVAPDIEFVATDLDPLAKLHSAVGTNTTSIMAPCRCCSRICWGRALRSPWRDLDNSIAHVAAEVRDHLPASKQRRDSSGSEVIRPVFYQISRAYIVGRVVGREFVLPL